MEEKMSDLALAKYLEVIAQLIEAKLGENGKEAAAIVRSFEP